MYEKNVMPEKQALNSQKRLFYPVSQPSLNEIADMKFSEENSAMTS